MLKDLLEKYKLAKELERILLYESEIGYPKKVLATLYYLLEIDIGRRKSGMKISQFKSGVHALPFYNKIPFHLFKKFGNRLLDVDRQLYNSIALQLIADKPLREIILEVADPELCYIYAKTIKGIDVEPYSKKVIESKDVKWNYLFLKGVEGADKEGHKKVILDSDNNYLKNLLNNGKNSEKDEISKC